nr:IS4 family transposase [Paenibacillus bovis]
MNSVDQKLVFRQYLSYLPQNKLACPLHNYGYKELTDDSLVKIFLLAGLFRWDSLHEIEIALRSKKQITKELNIDSISASTLSRRLSTLNTSKLADILSRITHQYKLLKSAKAKGINYNVGLLRIIDSTHIKLPNSASSWTAVSKDSSSVKLHLRLAVASTDSVFPEKMVPSTANIADIDAVNYLIEPDNTLYVMDRGYAEKTKMGGWLERDINFLVRLKKTFRFETLRSYRSDLPNVTRYELVSIRTRPEKLKLIEFTDEEGTSYRLLTNKLDLSEQEILDTYKNRWYIELFFKWLKQHIKIDHLFSKSPIGIWNQLFIALITFGLLVIMRLLREPNREIWQFLKTIRQYLMDSWEEVQKEFNRKRKFSKGRQKIPDKRSKVMNFGFESAIVSPISKEHYTRK